MTESLSLLQHKTVAQAAVCVGIWMVLASAAMAQQASRWSTNSPPTPAVLKTKNELVKPELRRLPPIDQVETQSKPAPEPTGSVAMTTPSKTVPPTAERSEPTTRQVDWNNPRVVVGPKMPQPQSRPQPQPAENGSRFTQPSKATPSASQISSTTTTTKSSRYSQTATSPAKPATTTPSKTAPVVEPKQNQSEPVFARVYDDGYSEVMLATAEEGVSPIFICRILGFPATVPVKAVR